DVFAIAHHRVFPWLADGCVTGLRIDHPDGLFDPTAYFLELQESFVVARARKGYRGGDFAEIESRVRERFRAEPLDAPIRKALYVVVEKIQGGRERIPNAWAVHGTTGYRFGNNLGGLFVDRAHAAAMTEIYERFIDERVDFRELVYAKKKLIMSASMASELNVLAHELARIAELNRRTRDFTLNALRRA